MSSSEFSGDPPELSNSACEKAQMDVPLCKMISLQVVRPTLAIDIEKMKADFIHGYRSGAALLNMSTTNIQGSEQTVFDEDRLSWNAFWRRNNSHLEEFFNADPELRCLSNKMFYIHDGNHRLVARTEFIHQAHSNDLDLHFWVRTIVLSILDNVTNILTTMHDINRATENSHVKSNVVHTLHRMQKVGTLPINELRAFCYQRRFKQRRMHFCPIRKTNLGTTFHMRSFLSTFTV